MRWAALAIGLVVWAACDTRIHGIALGTLDASPACDPANIGTGLHNIQTHIFDKHCSSSTACHKDSIDDTDHLQLTDGTSFTNLVNAPSMAPYGIPAPAGKGTQQWIRVVPGAPAQSYLMVLIDPHENPSNPALVDPMGAGYGSAADINKATGSMPASAGELLCQGQIDVIKQWILDGAPDD
jgi:hypothetical protein